MPWIKNRPLRVALHWQLLLTVIIAIALAVISGLHSSISAFLGGVVSFLASAAYALIVSQHTGYTAGGTVRTALRAEAVKIVLTVVLLWSVFKFYEDVKAFVFIGTFIAIVVVQSMALLVADNFNKK